LKVIFVTFLETLNKLSPPRGEASAATLSRCNLYFNQEFRREENIAIACRRLDRFVCNGSAGYRRGKPALSSTPDLSCAIDPEWAIDQQNDCGLPGEKLVFR